MKRKFSTWVSMLLVASMLSMTACQSDESSSGKSKKSSKKETTEESVSSEENEEALINTETDPPSYAAPTSVPVPTPVSVTDLAALKADGEALVAPIVSQDMTALQTLCTSTGNAFLNMPVPEGAADVYAIYFQKMTFLVGEARGQENIGGNVTYQISFPDMDQILTPLGEVYTYDQVYQALSRSDAGILYGREIMVPFIYDDGRYLASDLSGIMNEAVSQLQKMAIRTYISQGEVDAIAGILFSALQSNDPDTFNAYAGSAVMTGWGDKAPLYSAIYANSEYSAEITTSGVDSTEVTLHLYVHDPQEALRSMESDPSNFILTFLPRTLYWIQSGELNDELDYSAYGGALNLFLPNASLLHIAVPVTITKNADGSYGVTGALSDLIVNFDEQELWSSGVSPDIYLATAQYLLNNGQIMQVDYDWMYTLFKTDLIPVSIEPGPYASYTKAFTAYPQTSHALPGITPGSSRADFMFLLPSDFSGADKHKVVAYINGDRIIDSVLGLTETSDGSIYMDFYYHSKSPFKSGEHKICIYYPGDMDEQMLFATITFIIP